MPKKKPEGERAVDQSTNIRVRINTVQRWLGFLSDVTKKTASDIIEELLMEKYPNIQEDVEQWESTKRKFGKKYDEGNGGK